MRGIKIPQYEFALKMQGGLMREGGKGGKGGGRICGTVRYLLSQLSNTQMLFSLSYCILFGDQARINYCMI